MVDPYDWLGLPKDQRPPTWYQLLGLDPCVTDQTAIRAASDRQLRRVLPHLTSADALDAERLWSELEEARDTLLDAEKRADYDATLPAPTETSNSEQPPAIPDQPEHPADATPLSPDELNAATLPDPQPWWKSAPEAPSAADPWWKETTPEEPAPPPPPSPATTTAATAAAPTHSSPAHAAHTPPAVRKPSPILILVAGLFVAGVIVVGVYSTFSRGSAPTAPAPKQDPATVETSGSNPRPKRPDTSSPKTDEPATGVSLDKNAAEKLRPRTFSGHTGAVNGLAVSSAGQRFASVATDRTLRFWSLAGDESTIRHTFVSPAVGVAWYGKDRGIAAADGLSLALFDAEKTVAPRIHDSARGGIACLAVTGDGSRALTGLKDGFVRLWDCGSGRADEWAVAARGPITAIDLSTDATHALVAVADGPVALWNLAGRNRAHEWNPHPGGAIAIKLSPDGTQAATAGADGSAVIHSLATRKDICRFDGHVGPVTGIAWLPDGRQVVSVGVDGTARLWNAQSGQPLRWFQTLNGKANCVAVDPDGRFILAGTSTGVIHLFPLPRVRPEVVTGPVAKPPARPLPVPDADAVTAALAVVRNELSHEFAYDRPDDLAMLAEKLCRRAAVDRITETTRFGLLQEARTLAVRAGDPTTAFEAIEDLAAWFDVDEFAEKAATFSAMPDDADLLTMLNLGLAAAERAELDARPEVVGRILRRLPATLPAAAPADRAGRLAAIRRRASAHDAEIKNVRRAIEVLKNAPDDQASNHTLGSFLCFARQDWQAGLPLLAKGTDARVIDLAKADVAVPTDPKAQHRLGELWYSFAIDTKDHRAKRAILGRARTWFEREIKAKLEVVDAVKVRARLDDIAKLDAPGKDPTTLPLFAPLHVRRSYNTIASDVCKVEWRLDGGAVVRADAVLLPDGSPLMHSRFGLGAGGQLTIAIRPDGREIRINCAGQEFAFAGTGKSIQIVIERLATSVTVTAGGEDGDPVSRIADLPINARGPLAATLRLTGTAAHLGGATIVSAIVRGPASIPLPLVE